MKELGRRKILALLWFVCFTLAWSHFGEIGMVRTTVQEYFFLTSKSDYFLQCDIQIGLLIFAFNFSESFDLYSRSLMSYRWRGPLSISLFWIHEKLVLIGDLTDKAHNFLCKNCLYTGRNEDILFKLLHIKCEKSYCIRVLVLYQARVLHLQNALLLMPLHFVLV